MKRTLLLLSTLLAVIATTAQPASPAGGRGGAPQRSDEEAIRAVADNILRQPVRQFVATDGKTYNSTSEIPAGTVVRLSSPLADWHYSNGVINIAMIDLGKYLGEEKYIEYAKAHIAFGFDNYKYFQGTIPEGRSHVGWPFGTLWTFKELDDCGAMGASVVEVNKLDNQPRYREYIDNSVKHVMTGQLRLADGTLVRAFPHKNTVWADDVYMATSLLIRMGKFTGDVKYLDEAVKQIMQIGDYLWDESKGLYYHCYYTDLKRNGVAYWGRATGWIMISTADLIEALPENHPKRAELIKRLERQIVGASRYQAQSGMWHQLLDKNDSYEESSVTAMYTYSIAKAVNNKWIDASYAVIARNAWNAMKNTQITSDGKFTNVCVGTGINESLVFYYTRPVGDNEKHGLGLIIGTGIEMMKLNANRTR